MGVLLAGFSTTAMAQEAELNAALQAIKNNSADKAELVKTAQKKNKKNADALVAIGQAFLQQNDTAQARIFGNLADVAAKHKSAPAFILLGDVEAYANDLCISPKYLTTICKRHSGKTANEWITEHVLEDIRYYLKQTDLSVKQICDRLGFPNPSFFGKYVREHFGMTPLAIRNS